MAGVLSVLAVREPDMQAAAKSIGRGFGPKLSKNNGLSLSRSAAALLLSFKQVEALGFLRGKAAESKSDKPFKPAFDDAYAKLKAAVLSGDIKKIDNLANQLLKKYPVIPLANKSNLEQSIYRFLQKTHKRLSHFDIAALWNSVSADERKEYLDTALARVDAKCIALYASAVLKNLGYLDHNLITDLRGELVFSLTAFSRSTLDLIATAQGCQCEDSKKQDWENFPLPVIKASLELPAEIEDWALKLDPFGQGQEEKSDKTSRLLAKYKKIESKKALREEQQARCEETDAAGNRSLHECDCDCVECCIEPDPYCGGINYYIADLLELREETTCYKASDLAYIENVAPGETRIRKHGFNKTIDVFSEDETTESRKTERDHQVTEKFSLQTEMHKQVAANLDTSASVSGKGTGYKYSMNTSLGLSKNVSNRESREKFKEMVSRAAETIQVETRSLRSRRVTTQMTESNKHKLQNSTTLPFVAKYFHVSQEKRGQVFSYGKRLMVDLLIPSPAALYRKLEKAKAELAFDLEKPTSPRFLDDTTGQVRDLKPSDIEQDNYVDIYLENKIREFDAAPKMSEVISIPLAGTPGDPKPKNDSVGSGQATETIPVNVPEGFIAINFSWNSGNYFGNEGMFSIISATLGGKTLHHRNTSDGSFEDAINTHTLNNLSGSHNLTFFRWNAGSYDKVAIIDCSISDAAKLKWQLSVYTTIMEKYESELQAYNDAREEWKAQQQEKLSSRHPFTAEELMRSFVKRSAIWMMCDHFDDQEVMEMMTPDCGYPEINRPAASNATKRWYFYDRAFDWNLAEIKFYDFFRNPQCLWPETFDPDEGNFLFKAFERAGYCRVQVPAAEGMGDDVAYYLQYKEIWGQSGDIPRGPSDTRYASVVQEIKHQHKCYQEDRGGCIQFDPSLGLASNKVILKFANDDLTVTTDPGDDPYWDELGSLGNQLDITEISLDENREIFIQGISYRIVSISGMDSSGVPVAASTSQQPAYYVFTLDRAFEGQSYNVVNEPSSGVKCHTHAIGAEYVGDPFYFELPTDLIWLGDQKTNCLPCYPVECCDDPMVGQNSFLENSDVVTDLEHVVGDDLLSEESSENVL